MALIINKSKTIKTLNAFYERLNERAIRLVNTLRKLDADVDWGWFAGHTVEIKGEMAYEAFPIPVITLKNVCEIGLDIDGAFVEGKLYSDEVAGVDFSRLKHYDFCVYGSENYLEDLFNSKIHSMDDIASMLFTTDKELCVNITFDTEPDAGRIIEVCAILKAMGTHVLTEDMRTDVNENEAIE